MLMKAKERWHCVSLGCGCQVIVEIGGEIHGHNPRCACGGVMRKKYASPAFAYLDFLRIDEPVVDLSVKDMSLDDISIDRISMDRMPREDMPIKDEPVLTPAGLTAAASDDKSCPTHR